MDEIQIAQLIKLNQMVVDGKNLNEEQKELRRELSAAVAAPPGEDNQGGGRYHYYMYTAGFLAYNYNR